MDTFRSHDSLACMEATAAIAIIETDLRRLVNAVLTGTDGADWKTSCFDKETIEKLEFRLGEEKKRRAPALVSEDLLAYTHLYELRTLIEKSWPKFKVALGDSLGGKTEFAVMMDKVEDFRNAPAHSRELLPFERAMLEGISGEIRTKVTRHLSEQSADSMHYPIIEYIRDSFGNTPRKLDPEPLGSLHTEMHLEVGQHVEFECRAWDPQGRELTWVWGVGLNVERGGTAKGTSATFSWSPTEKDVGRYCAIFIQITSSGPYHRFSNHDQSIAFVYTVDPPLG